MTDERRNRLLVRIAIVALLVWVAFLVATFIFSLSNYLGVLKEIESLRKSPTETTTPSSTLAKLVPTVTLMGQVSSGDCPSSPWAFKSITVRPFLVGVNRGTCRVGQIHRDMHG